MSVEVRRTEKVGKEEEEVEEGVVRREKVEEEGEGEAAEEEVENWGKEAEGVTGRPSASINCSTKRKGWEEEMR